MMHEARDGIYTSKRHRKVQESIISAAGWYTAFAHVSTSFNLLYMKTTLAVSSQHCESASNRGIDFFK
jgi:hypothetical protein